MHERNSQVDIMRAWLASTRRLTRNIFRRDAPEFASAVSLLACVILAVGSLVIGVLERSLIIQTNGYITLIDIGNSLLFLAAVQRSSRNPDLTFNYGYGKYESLAILASATLLTILTIFTLIEAMVAFREPPTAHNLWLLISWSVLSLFVMRVTAGALDRYANRFHMPMFRYDAELWRVDSWLELGVIAGLLIGGVLYSADLRGAALIVDGVASILLLLVTLKVPLTHGREAFRQLLDRTLPDEMQYEILAIIAQNYKHMCEFKSVHTRQSGKDIFIEIDLVMPFDYTLDQLYVLEANILGELRERFPTAIPRVYVTPCDHSCVTPEGSLCPVKRDAQSTTFLDLDLNSPT